MAAIWNMCGMKLMAHIFPIKMVCSVTIPRATGWKTLVGGSYDPAAHTLTIAFSADSGYRAPDEGTKVSVSYTMYEYGMFMFQSCEKVYMESNDVYASLGMTFVTYNVKDLYMNRTNLRLREGSERLMTSTADGLHANGCYGDMIVTNSLYEASHDDAMNICSFYNTVSSYAGNTLSAELLPLRQIIPSWKGM